MASSAGGLPALRIVLSGLPSNFGAPVLIAQHLAPRHDSLYASILDRTCALLVTEATHGEPARPGHVYVGPPDHHLLVDAGGRLMLTRDPPIRFLRPAADLLFCSAAEHVGAKAMAVVLSGSGADGTEGIRAVKAAGGQVIAQDAATADFPSMPRTATLTGLVDRVLPLAQIAHGLQSWLKPIAI